MKRTNKEMGDDALEIARLQAERDGWREIANDLARVAFGKGYETFELPPIEMIGQREGQRGPITPLLKQWWADMTREHGRVLGNEREMARLASPDRLAVKLARSILGARTRAERYDREYDARGEVTTTIIFRSLDRIEDDGNFDDSLREFGVPGERRRRR